METKGIRGKRLVALALTAEGNEENELKRQDNKVSSSTRTYALRGPKQINYYAQHSDSSECPSDFSAVTLSDGEATICSESVSSESSESDREMPLEINEGLFNYENVNEISPQVTVIQSSTVITGEDPDAMKTYTTLENLDYEKESAIYDTENALITSKKTSETSKEIDIQNTFINKNVDRVIANFGKIVAEPIDSIEHFRNTRPWTKKTTCPYCFEEVTHFPRHLTRNHKEEGAVKELLTMSLQDPKRKDLLNVIRRQGNYFYTTQANVIRPVRRPKECYDKPANQTSTENVEKGKDRYVACQDCFGFFKRKFLRRHRKVCTVRPKNMEFSKRENHLTESQMFLVCGGACSEFYNSLRLKKEVFKIMRADAISKVAMKDVLICSYGESLLTKHKRTQIRTCISNKMRELSRLLITLRQKMAVERLLDVLKPEYFDNIVLATKIISGYDPNTRTFKASSLALHMGTTLKQVCDIATKLIIKKSQFLTCNDPEQSLKSLKRIRNLIDNHWNSEVSSLALKNLNEKRWEKPKLFPLTRDVIKFHQYVMKQAKAASENLNQGNQLKKELRRLSENVLALTLLLNRKRIGEIQYLKVKTYTADVPVKQQSEFIESLSETEKVLTKNFKRIVTGGKGSKPVAILFPKNVQNFIGVMLDVRSKCIPDTNEYLFANPSTENRWLSGYHVLKKLACESGIENKDLFTSTRLRKQIATVLQVMNITDTEMEQFAAFMGHTKKTHESYYRLPQDVYQTAKVSKLLMAINKGKCADYKGKTLDEIEFSDNVDSDESDEEPSVHDPQVIGRLKDIRVTTTSGTSSSSTSNLTSVTRPVITTGDRTVNDICLQDTDPEDVGSHSASPDSTIKGRDVKQKITRVRWTADQTRAITAFFKDHIKSKIPPKKHEVEVLMGQHKGLFKEKNWIKIKAYVYNCYKKK